jgi:DNA topoisomerase-1
VPGDLVYVSDEVPGIRRVRKGQGFAYLDPEGRPVRDAEVIARIRSLAIPPAYRSVWICTLPHGHLQATGRDARGRKQYRYHPEWQGERGEHKYGRLEAFGEALPRIRARVSRDLREATRADAPPRPVVLATLVRLLDRTWARIGNESYARENGSYGLSTLRNRHAGVRGAELRLQFRGKSGIEHRLQLHDPAVARVVRRCQQLPGQALFQYCDAQGELHSVGSGDVNDYLCEAAGERYTAKDFRTWHASVHALALMADSTDPPGPRRGMAVLKDVAAKLGNTVAVCRKAYVHPAVLALALEDPVVLPAAPGAPRGLRADERRLLQFLRERRER